MLGEPSGPGGGGGGVYTGTKSCSQLESHHFQLPQMEWLPLRSERSQCLSLEFESRATEVPTFTCFASLSEMAVNSAVLSLTELPRNGGMPMSN